MSKLIKYLKPFVVSIFVIIALLLVQAVCDLSLPDYTANIVNVGIQQGGVPDAVPTIIREKQLNGLVGFLKPEQKEWVLNQYTSLNKETLDAQEYEKYLEEYPILEKETLYRLNTKDKKVLDELNKTFSKPMVIALGMEAKGSQKQMNSQAMAAQFEAMPESMITQAAVNYVKKEYEAIGISSETLQNHYIFKTGSIMMGIALLSMVCAVFVGYLGSRVAAGFSQRLRREVFGKVIDFSNTEYDGFSTASLITRSTNDIQQIQMLVLMTFRIICYAPLLGIGGIIKVLGTDTSMGWIIVLAVSIIMVVVVILFTVVVPKFKSVQKLIDRLNQVTREILTGMLVIRAFSTQKHEEKRFDKANMDLTKTNLFVNRTMALMMPVMMLVMNGITILIVWVGAHQIDSGAMQVGDMMAFIQYTMQIIMAFLMISMVSIMLPRALVSAQRISEILGTKSTIEDPIDPAKIETSNPGTVEFKDVSFRYQGAEDDVISDISFVAKPGETTAIIGSTGSGKSTLVNLIPRFYDVTQGSILIDGVDIRSICQKDLHDKIGYAPQKGILFTGTIDSNIAYGQKKHDEAAIKKSAEIAQAIEFISEKEEGFNSPIAEGGNNVSGGQKQRLSIARAIAKNPEIYIFDDSFSALDLKTDSALRKALKKSTKERTVLIVAQRISTIMQAEQIIVLDEGNVVGKGTHKELLKDCEVYKQIALSQLSQKELMA
ncbi:MAG: ABC transporter ATP-binding protein [Cellulosilyticaceae bacterium]